MLNLKLPYGKRGQKSLLCLHSRLELAALHSRRRRGHLLLIHLSPLFNILLIVIRGVREYRLGWRTGDTSQLSNGTWAHQGRTRVTRTIWRCSSTWSFPRRRPSSTNYLQSAQLRGHSGGGFRVSAHEQEEASTTGPSRFYYRAVAPGGLVSVLAIVSGFSICVCTHVSPHPYNGKGVAG
jgi:hypothetical protein